MAEEGGVDGVVDVVELESYFFIFCAAASILFEFGVRICWLTEKRGRRDWTTTREMAFRRAGALV